MHPSQTTAYVLTFLSGLLLANSIPHLAAGLRGARFPTPFSKPRGVGTSSAVINALWGTANLALGLQFLVDNLATALTGPGRLVLLGGFLVAALYTANHFGRVRRDADARPDGDRLG